MDGHAHSRRKRFLPIHRHAVRTVRGINRKAAVWTGKKEVPPLADNSQQFKRPAPPHFMVITSSVRVSVCGTDVLNDADGVYEIEGAVGERQHEINRRGDHEATSRALLLSPKFDVFNEVK